MKIEKKAAPLKEFKNGKKDYMYVQKKKKNERENGTTNDHMLRPEITDQICRFQV
jgi:hypothetical protein